MDYDNNGDGILRRYKSSELGESAGRRYWFDFQTDYAKSGRSMCRQCRTLIPMGEVRVALMLQEEEGYKNACWTHFNCFWIHRETAKLRGLHEIVGLNKLKEEDQARFAVEFCKKFPGAAAAAVPPGGEAAKAATKKTAADTTKKRSRASVEEAESKLKDGKAKESKAKDASQVVASNGKIPSNLELSKLLKKEYTKHSGFKANAWYNAAAVVEWHPVPIISREQAAELPGIGPSISAFIGEKLAQGLPTSVASAAKSKKKQRT